MPTIFTIGTNIGAPKDTWIRNLPTIHSGIHRQRKVRGAWQDACHAPGSGVGAGAEICKLPQERGAVSVCRVPVCINCHHKIHGADTLQAATSMVSEMMPGVPMPDHATMFRRIRGLSVQAMGSMVAVTARDGTRHVLCSRYNRHQGGQQGGVDK